MYPYNYSEKRMTAYVVRNDKANLVLNGQILDCSYPSLLSHEFDNIVSDWDSKAFFGGELTKPEYIAIREAEYNVKLSGLLQIVQNDKVLKEANC